MGGGAVVVVLVLAGVVAALGGGGPEDRPPEMPEPSPGVSGIELPPPPDSAVSSRVLRVVDGDTVALARLGVGTVDRSTGGARARLIGVDTPEVHGTVECYGRQASDFTERELGGRDVLVDFDVQPTDRFGRALVYIWTSDGFFFNARLVEAGFAQQLTIPPNVRYAELFTELVRSAREDGRGLWGDCAD